MTNTLIVGVGNPIRGDDAVGIRLAERLQKHFEPDLDCIILLEPDMALAEKISAYDELIVIDAVEDKQCEPYKLIALEPSGELTLRTRFCSSHVFDWPAILTTAGELFDHCPRASLLAVAGYEFDFSEEISTECLANADKAFEFIKQVAVRDFGRLTRGSGGGMIMEC